MNRPTLPQVARALAAFALLSTLGAAFGPAGLLAGVATATALYVLSPMYAFVIGQLAVGVLAPAHLLDSLTQPALIGAELALLLGLWSDLTQTSDRATLPWALTATVVLGGFTALVYGETESLWLTGGVLLASIVTLAYALHRYTVVFILEEAPA